MIRHAIPFTLALVVTGAVMSPALGAPGGAVKPGSVRPSAIAGTWYPGSRSVATATAFQMMRLARQAPRPPGRPVALVVPHAGWTYSGVAAGAAFRLLARGAYARVVVMAPSHYGGFTGYALDDASAYRTPLGDVPVDRAAVESLRSGSLARTVQGVTGPEHALEIELPFLQAALGPFTLVPILVGRTGESEERAFAERLAALDDGKTLFVFSTDFTHYGPRFDYTPFGAATATLGPKIKELDRKAADLVARVDASGFRAYLEKTGATICGRHGLSTLLELLPRIAPGAHATLVSHYASGELPGMRDDSSVDYVGMAFTRQQGSAGPPLGPPPVIAPVAADAPPLPASLGTALARVARAALETELAGADTLAPALAALGEAPELARTQAVFVTLKRTDPVEVSRLGDLRGCIGQVVPTHPLDLAVVQSALEAALEDPRFPPVEASELPHLAVEVTVLSPIRPVGGWKDIHLGEHGIVLEKSGRRALFLPQVPGEQGWTLGQTLDHLAAKAGLPAGAWREGAKLSVFSGQVFHEPKEKVH